MTPRSTGARLALALAAATAAALSLAAAPARADMLHAIYRVSLVGLPIGTAVLDADLSPSSYTIRADARLTGLAKLFANARGASTGNGAIVEGRIAPATFATTAASSQMTRTIRMALAGNAVTGVDIAPPFDEKPDRVPLGPNDEQNIVDPVGAAVIPAPASGAMAPPTACNRKIPIFDGYTRFDIDLTYVGERSAKAKGYNGPVAVCAVRYVPISGHSPDRPATKFMAENKDVEVWLAPIEADRVGMQFRVSVRTMIGTTVVEAQEFRVNGK